MCTRAEASWSMEGHAQRSGAQPSLSPVSACLDNRPAVSVLPSFQRGWGSWVQLGSVRLLQYREQPAMFLNFLAVWTCQTEGHGGQLGTGMELVLRKGAIWSQASTLTCGWEMICEDELPASSQDSICPHLLWLASVNIQKDA